MATSVTQKRNNIQRLESQIKDMERHVKNGTYSYGLSDYNAEIHFKKHEVIRLRNAVCDQITAMLRCSNDKMREFITQEVNNYARH